MPEPRTKARIRPSQLLRWGLAAAIVLATLFGLHALLGLADAALALWLRLRELPTWVSLSLGLAATALLGGSGWLVWRLLRPPAERQAIIEPVDRPRLEQRIARLDAPAAALAGELAEMDRRRDAGIVQVALFGEISSGKSSLLRAIAPESAPTIAASGGSTRRIEHARGRLPDGRELQVADVPGLNEAGGEARAASARDEAARAHALVFVADGDLTRSQDTELRRLLASGRPLLLALNKSDRYREDERALLLARLRERYPAPQVTVCPVSAGYTQSVLRELPDGTQLPEEREQPAQVAALLDALARIVARGAAALEPAREAATLSRLDERLSRVEIEQRQADAEACVGRYTRRAVVGALAAVAPGTDLLIQGALATAMVRELCALHTLQARDIDLDSLIARAGSTVRTSTAVTLAIAGNALKAFPGAGTLGGGLVHAVAYGMIFDALGRAVAQTLAETRSLDREATLQAFSDELQRPSAERLRALAALAWDATTRRSDDIATRDRPHSGHGA